MAYHDIRTETSNFFYFSHKDAYADPHFHSSSEFFFLEQGEMLVTVGGETRHLKAGDACYSPEFCIHSYYRSTKSVLTYALLCQKQYVDRLFTLFDKKQPPRFFKFDDFEFLAYFHNLCHQPYGNESHRQNIIEGFLQILYTKIAAQSPFVSRKTEKQGNLVVEILQYANEHYDSDLSLEVLSKQFGYAKESISRILHKHLSESWNSYTNRLRVQHAHRILMNNPDKTVLEVAYLCGFNSPNTFYRAYLDEFGHPPRK